MLYNNGRVNDIFEHIERSGSMDAGNKSRELQPIAGRKNPYKRVVGRTEGSGGGRKGRTGRNG